VLIARAVFLLQRGHIDIQADTQTGEHAKSQTHHCRRG